VEFEGTLHHLRADRPGVVDRTFLLGFAGDQAVLAAEEQAICAVTSHGFMTCPRSDVSNAPTIRGCDQ
jgi:hypothetical protein